MTMAGSPEASRGPGYRASRVVPLAVLLESGSLAPGRAALLMKDKTCSISNVKN